MYRCIVGMYCCIVGMQLHFRVRALCPVCCAGHCWLLVWPLVRLVVVCTAVSQMYIVVPLYHRRYIVVPLYHRRYIVVRH